MNQAAAKTQAQGSPFWQFSLAFYRAPGVADACIRLQDACGVDVNLLFFLLWHAALKRRFSTADVEAADNTIRNWRMTAVIPLRNVRRALKNAAGLTDPGAAEAFRTKVKGLELEAERLQQEALFAFSQSAPRGELVPSADEAARANIQAYEQFCKRTFRQEPVEAILKVFATLERRETER